jgi:hypothetical protein
LGFILDDFFTKSYLIYQIFQLPPDTLAGFDLTTHYTPGGDDSTSLVESVMPRQCGAVDIASASGTEDSGSNPAVIMVFGKKSMQC